MATVSTKELNRLLSQYKGDKNGFIRAYKAIDSAADSNDVASLYDRANPSTGKDTGGDGSGMKNLGQFGGDLLKAGSISNPTMDNRENVGVSGVYETFIDKSTGKLKTFGEMVSTVGTGIQEAIILQFEQQQKLQEKINTDLGMTGKLSEDFRSSITDAYPNAMKLGYSFSDLSESITQMNKGAGTFRLTSVDTINKLTETGRVFFNRLDDAADAVNAFQNISLGAKDAMNAVQQAGKDSLELGLNSKTTTATLVANIDKLNQYGFKNGVNGLNTMVQKAQQLKMDMQSVFTLAEKVMDPEGALSMAANLQAIGGAMGSFSDPIKMMYDATNNVEDLQDALVGAAESLATYNSEQGRFEVTGANLRKAQAMAKELGISYQELTKLSVQAAQRTSAAADLMASGLTFKDDADKEFLTNLAQMKDGKMVIEVPPKLQERLGATQVALETMDETQKNQLLAYREEFKKMSMEDIATQQVGLIENINRDVNFIAAAARVQLGKSGETLVKTLGFDPVEIAKKARDAAEAAKKGVDAVGEAAQSGIKNMTNYDARQKAKAEAQPQTPVNTADAEKAKAEAEKAKTQAAVATQNNQSNVNLKVTADVRSDDFARLVMKQPEIASKFFDSYDSYTSTAN
jgi:hypothetical protein